MKICAWSLLLASVWASAFASAQRECVLIPVGTGSIQACSVGAGSVTVILAAGAGQTSRTWGGLLPRLTPMARVVTFDRPGLGGSPPGQLPRTPTRIARELRDVVEALALSGPQILVGHSMGGVHVLRYATLFPDEVAGVVILDTPPPNFEQRRLGLLSPDERFERKRVLRDGAARAPEVVRLEREGAKVPSEWDFTAFPDDLPLTVIVADAQDFGELGSLAAHRQLWLEDSHQWLGLTSRSSLSIAEGSGHMVHHERPELVVEHILSMAGGVEEQ